MLVGPLHVCLLSVFNLTNGVDVKETEERIAAYRKENQDVIKKNKSKRVFCICCLLSLDPLWLARISTFSQL